MFICQFITDLLLCSFPLYLESALSDLRIAISRSDIDIKFVKQLPQLGWRFRKQSFVVIFKENSKTENLLHWTPFGPDKCLEDEELNSVLKSLTTLQVFILSKYNLKPKLFTC